MVACSLADLGQWHIALSHNIAIFGRCHVTYVRGGRVRTVNDIRLHYESCRLGWDKRLNT